ncbi:autotransporter-associated beta strand repeat-containing protein [Luteolibacter arcticus]|uniref:Autotransporter-associated beta strand repeat-containing protein n=1 Tax=Luteolibacter arcticus TaxID=1581411 RepID=A0ABT3GPC9_9BACT|nr:autotransporter-associated beta strand repeat-containing protein [Luteolibacter arcticus]MCW1925352.1 autotransporter-associated beta strand repeat-containing protein [Luteolibacter arcticus]
MKPSSHRILPHTLVVCAAPLLASLSANGHVVSTNESNKTGAWTLPAGPNLLTGVTPSPATVAVHEVSNENWSTVIDGTLGDVLGSPGTSCTPSNGDTVTFPLDLTGHPGGRNITSFDSYCTWVNGGRDNQDYTLQYSTVANPAVFINIHTPRLQTQTTGGDRSTHQRLTDTSGFLATGVHSIRLIFNAQENGYVGYREFVLQDAASVVCVSNEKNNDNVWILPPGPNLLTAPVTTPAVHEDSSNTWETTLDGSVGNHNSTASSVTPTDGSSVVFPLDLAGHPGGRNLVSFDSYAAWSSDGRDDQHYTLEYSTVGDPATFLPITAVAAHSEYVNGPRRATHSRITSSTGTLATGVHSVRLTFNGQENGFEGYREFIARDSPLPVVLTHESNNTDAWTLPIGTNLLSNTLPKTPPTADGFNHGNGDITNSDWTILTDGLLGTPGNQFSSVAPLNGASVILPLDTSANTNGYNISSFDSYCSWGNSGRDDQNYTISYSVVGSEATFIPLQVVVNHTIDPTNSTHTRLTAASGFLATNVAAVKIDFQGQENGYTGFREFIALGSAVPLAGSLTWSGTGSANWINGPDNNWKDGTSGLPANFTSLAPLTFDSTGINPNINLPAALTAADVTFVNDAAHPYTFGGAALTVTNGLTLSGAGNASFGNSVQAASITVSGTGNLTLAGSNSSLTGIALVSNGTLTLASNDALGAASLVLTGGTASFTSALPSVSSLSGTSGAITLGNAATSADTDLQINVATALSYAGSISDASGTANGRLTKSGSDILTLSGTNSYTGPTTVTDGTLRLNNRLSLYNGNTAAWTASNILIQGFSELNLRVGGAGEFTGTDVAALNTGGFDADAILSLDTTSGNYEISSSIGGSIDILKKGPNTLTLSGSNTFTGSLVVTQGTIAAANPSGTSLPGDLEVGNSTSNAWVNMLASNQFGPTSLIRFDTGPGTINGKVQLRGTNQTVAGLESFTNNRIAIIQNDETTTPGYTVNPGPATLTINTPVDAEYTFHGIIRNQDGGAVSLVKTGPGRQELINAAIQGHSYNGPTTISEGTFRLNFSGGNSGFNSNITIEEDGIFNLHSTGTGYDFNPIISGEGSLLVTGGIPAALTNGLNSWTGGTTVDGGFFALKTVNGDDIGQGNAPGQTCVGGAMTPLNVINVINEGTLSLDNAAPLGNSPVLPQFAPTILINEGCKLYGGTNTVAFVSNITLDGGEIDLTNGAATGAFNTNLCFVGTLVVGGSSILPSSIFTSGTGDNANASLGSAGLPGTVFQVANVTGNADADLTVSSILRNVGSAVSPLTKTGPGTMTLTGANVYTGDTTVSGGELVVNGVSIADTNKLVLDGGKLGLTANETVGTLFFGGAQQLAGTYGSTDSTATNKNNDRFSGSGVLTVTSGPGVSYESWASIIPNPADRDRTDDPDGDGFENLEEFLFGTSPIATTGSLAQVEKTGSGMIVRWNQRATGSSVYALQENTTLVSPWPASPATISNDPVQDVPNYVRKQAVIPVDSVRKFVRVEATE